MSAEDVERLVRGEGVASEYGALAELLAAAAKPVRPVDATRYAAVREEFQRAVVERGGSPDRSWFGRRAITSRGGTRLGSRMTALKVAGLIFLLSLAGVAAAAEGGGLPAPVQRVVHNVFGDLGVPPPAPAGAGDGGGESATNRAASPHNAAGAPTPTPSSSWSPSSTAPSGPSAAVQSSQQAETFALNACRTLVQSGKNGAGKVLDHDTRKALAALAGGEQHVQTFCARLLATADSSPTGAASSAAPAPALTATPAASSDPTKSHPTPPGNPGHTPGGGNGHGHTPKPSH